jgi:hypothetical protein
VIAAGSSFTPDNPLALGLTALAFLIIAAALVIANKGTRDRF